MSTFHPAEMVKGTGKYDQGYATRLEACTMEGASHVQCRIHARETAMCREQLASLRTCQPILTVAYVVLWFLCVLLFRSVPRPVRTKALVSLVSYAIPGLTDMEA